MEFCTSNKDLRRIVSVKPGLVTTVDSEEAGRGHGFRYGRLRRPYDFRVLIEAYVYTQRHDFVHADFGAYYAGLLANLERLFDVRFARDELSHRQRVLWSLFGSTVRSLLQVSTPWDGYLETGLLDRTLEESGETGVLVERASTAIAEAAKASRTAHREMLQARFVGIFGECRHVVTSDELQQAGFDDSREPDITNYYDYV